MASFQLEAGEQIILETEDVVWVKDNDISLKALTLSNKYLYIIYKKKNGIFLKSTIETIKRPLSDIVIRNGEVMVTKENISRGPCLQIQFIQGKEQFYFYNSARKNIKNWIDEIYIVLVGHAPSPSKKKSSRFWGLFDQKEPKYADDSKKSNSYAPSSNPATSSSQSGGSRKQSEESTHYSDFTIHEESNAYCSRCGDKLDPSDRFCPTCGTPVFQTGTSYKEPSTHTKQSAQNDEDYRSRRKQEFAGTVIKCPACGEEIPSFTAICPACGHEINSARVSSAIKEFSMLINQADEAIANSPTAPKNGWNSWSTWVKIGWVILNIYTLCVPFLIYTIIPLFGIGTMSSLTAEEKKKAQLISNYTFPNDRESILEALLFIKVQMESLASGKIDRNVYRWMGIWKSKASQLYEKAEAMFKGDVIANNAFTDVLSCEKKVNRSLRVKVIMAIVVFCIFATIFIVFRGKAVLTDIEKTQERIEQRAEEREAKQAARAEKRAAEQAAKEEKKTAEQTAKEEEEIRKANATFVWPTQGIALHVPEPPINKGEISRNDAEELDFEVRGVDRSQYEAYQTTCINSGYSVDSDLAPGWYEAYNEDGYFIRMYYYESGSFPRIDVYVSAPMIMDEIQWPNSEIAKRLPVPESSLGKFSWERSTGFCLYIGNTTKDEYKQYVDRCYEMGFTVNYSKGDTFFRAHDADGFSIEIKYKGYNIMFIQIDDPDE